MKILADRALRRLREARFLRGSAVVLETPPVRACDDGVILFSMIGTRVVLPYLAAAKSLHANLGRGRFVVLDDGTLTEEDREVLARHLDRPEIRRIGDVTTGDCPTGGCWERLLTLLDLRRDNYVIQLDSDTVTLGPVPEVSDAIDAKRDFTLRGDATAQWQPLEAFAGTSSATDHVQTAIEAQLGRLAPVLPAPGHYVRGCAGFAGFASGGLGRETTEAVSREASAILGPARWAEWGSEQVMSNLIVANEGEPILLPYARYLNYWNEPIARDAAFVHFVGTYRYHRGAYAQAVRRAVERLSAPVARAA